MQDNAKKDTSLRAGSYRRTNAGEGMSSALKLLGLPNFLRPSSISGLALFRLYVENVHEHAGRAYWFLSKKAIENAFRSPDVQ